MKAARSRYCASCLAPFLFYLFYKRFAQSVLFHRPNLEHTVSFTKVLFLYIILIVHFD